MNRLISILVLILFLTTSCLEEKGLLYEIIDSDPFLKEFASNDTLYRIQVRYTQIGSDEIGAPQFRHYNYNVCEDCYFDPGNAVRLPLALLALEKINTSVNQDSTIKEEIKKIFCFDDDGAYGRLYEQLGESQIQTRLKEIGAFGENADFDENKVTIKDLEGILLRALYPESFKPNQRFDLSRDDYNFLLKTMSSYPRDLNNPEIDQWSDSKFKYFIFGETNDPIPENFKIYSKSGKSSGYLTDCAFIQDLENEIEFFITATILAGKNDSLEYESIGIPFLSTLGKRVYEYELSQKEAGITTD